MINNPEQVVIDFYTTTGYLTTGVNNTVYYQVWSNAQRTDPLDITGASLKQRLVINRVATETILIDRNVSSVVRGKGSFDFFPAVNQNLPYVEMYVGTNVIRRNVTLTNPLFQTNNTSEVFFKILNVNRVLANNEDLIMSFATNNQVNSSDTYLLQIKLKDTIIF